METLLSERNLTPPINELKGRLDKVDNTLINILQHSMDGMKASSINLKALVNLLDNAEDDSLEAKVIDSGGPSSRTKGKKNMHAIKNHVAELKSIINRMDNVQARMEKLLGETKGSPFENV